MVPKVLIVDDLKDNRLVVKLTLKKSGDYQFLEAVDGSEAIDIATKELPHIILMDAMMPVMDGFEAIKLLRDDPITKKIPILMISALDNKDEKVRALKSGISDFISKPFDKTELIIRVNSLLNLYMEFLAKEKELKDINDNLEAKVNEKLDRRISEIKLASIGQVSAGITHELNTPVTYMKSNIELLEYDIEDLNIDEELKKPILYTIDILNDGINRIRNIIDTTKEIVKKGSNEFSTFNLYETVIYATRMIYSRAKHITPIYINNIPFTLDLSQHNELFEASIIKEKIEQVWIIFLNNACDEFLKSKKDFNNRRIDIKITHKEDKINLIFKDNAGDGISDNIIDEIFEPLVGTKTNSGMGLGLNIAKQIIEQHNGTIKAYNEDKIAVFEVEI
ncbi:MAG: hybrid sensor histidine kinase/response regulator [Campylobacterota bacterium]|nr:hybrid sensor histidine kinase/response regulator [Campylobacterota bacterium]